jgi:hypothetical protein
MDEAVRNQRRQLFPSSQYRTKAVPAIVACRRVTSFFANHWVSREFGSVIYFSHQHYSRL